MLKAEKKRLLRLKSLEAEIKAQGYKIIVGIDEVGRGPLAGPVMAAACFIPDYIFIEGIKDSKLLSPKKRAHIFEVIRNNSEVIYGVGAASAEEIDLLNIYQATRLAMARAIEGLPIKPDYLLIDAMELPDSPFSQKKVIKGDLVSYCIAAASIIAKEKRDALMQDFDKEWPQYGFAQHKGYGTLMHKNAIQLHGLCSIHRKSFNKSLLML